MRPPIVQVGAQSVIFTLHAATRWQERCRPASSLRDAFGDLRTEVARHGRVQRRRPRGVELLGMRQKLQTVAWLTLENEAIAFPLATAPGGRLVAITCIARSQ